jgi:hypothetical protein
MEEEEVFKKVALGLRAPNQQTDIVPKNTLRSTKREVLYERVEIDQWEVKVNDVVGINGEDGREWTARIVEISRTKVDQMIQNVKLRVEWFYSVSHSSTKP